MGNAPVAINTMVIGLHDSGKSHFIKTASGDSDPTDGPTFGVYTASVRYRKRRVTFLEVPPWSLYLLPHQPQPSVLIWFVDAHDTLTEVYDGRNLMLHVLTRVPGSITRVCLVHNVGRPHANRREAFDGRYLPPRSAAAAEEPAVSWTGVLDVFFASLHTGLDLYATQLSYTDPKTPLRLMDWITGLL